MAASNLVQRFTPRETVLGEGSFGRVRLFYDAALDRDVAIKFFKPSAIPALPPLDEIRRTARLQHYNIVQVYDVLPVRSSELHGLGPSGDDALTYAIVMQLVTGPALSRRVGSAVSDTQIVAWAADVASALRYAHQHPRGGLIHGDLHGGNVLVHQDSSRSRAMVTDWGVSTLVAERSCGRGHTFAFAPETWEQAVPASDFWALGLLLAQLVGRVSLHYPEDLRGRDDLRGEPLSNIMRERALAAVRSRTSPPPIVGLVEGLLTVEPDQRAGYPQVHQAVEDLRERNRIRWNPPVTDPSPRPDEDRTATTAGEQGPAVDPGGLLEPLDRRAIWGFLIAALLVVIAIAVLSAASK
jgi:serine/threonine protein kinase